MIGKSGNKWIGLVLLGMPGLVQAQFEAFAPAGAGFNDSRDYVKVSVVPDRTKVAPGDQLRLAVIFDHQEGYHIHTEDPQVPKELGRAEDYYKTQIGIEEPKNGSIEAYPKLIQWPESHAIKVEFTGTPVQYKVFEGRAVAFVPALVSPEAPLGKVSLKVKPAFQVCNSTTCFPASPYPPREPGEAPEEAWLAYGYEVPIEIVSLENAQSRETIDRELFGPFSEEVWAKIGSGADFVGFDLFGWKFELNAGSGLGLGLLWIVAAFGGLLLNFTPCVLPVIPIKIMGLSHGAGDRKRVLGLGLVMAGGIVAFWMLLGGLIAGVSSFTATNQLFQYPLFTITVGVIIAVMAVGMCGLFSIQLPQFVYLINPRQDSPQGSFLFGVMTAVLSTPCTAPFMGAAAAWAATQPAPVTLTTFAFIGGGMASPYLVLSAFPALVSKMPRTGPASELIKQVMGLLMLGAAAYFAGVGLSGMLASPPDPPSRLYWWAVAVSVGAAGVWLGWRTLKIAKGNTNRIVFVGMGGVILLLSLWGGVSFTDKGPVNWIYYTPERFEEAKRAGRVVVMEFTAEWCLNCKGLEQSVLRQTEVAELLNEKGVAPIKVDITGRNLPGKEMLARTGRLTIPLLVVYSPDGQEVFKGDFYTVGQVLEAVAAAKGATGRVELRE